MKSLLPSMPFYVTLQQINTSIMIHKITMNNSLRTAVAIVANLIMAYVAYSVCRLAFLLENLGSVFAFADMAVGR